MKKLILGMSLISQISLAQTALQFKEACTPGRQITIGAVGDFLIHDPLQKKAQKNKTFKNQWREVQNYLTGADIMYGNLEVPTARGVDLEQNVHPDPGLVFDKKIYTSFPKFNVHPTLLQDIKDSGFDIISTANNHALDRGAIGIDYTIRELEQVGLTFTGTHAPNSRRALSEIVDSNGIRTAWISCTLVENIRDRNNLVNLCKRDQAAIIQEIQRLKDQVDAVIVTPHWGAEDTPRILPEQKEFARRFLDAGALAILGAHPHVIQPMEKYLTRDGRETFIIYSLANFISYQPRIPNKTSIVLFLGLTKTDDGRTIINGVRYLPTFMRSNTGNLHHTEIKAITPTWGQEGLEYLNQVLPIENAIEYGQEVITNSECANN